MGKFEPSNRVFVNETPVDVMMFSGGEVQVRIPSVFPHCVKAYLPDANALMELLLTVNALKQAGHDVSQINLMIPYLPYARQDRVCAAGEAFSLEVIAGIINRLGFRSVATFDVHSKVAFDLIPGLINILPHEMFDCPEGIDVIIAPDEGAKVRAGKYALEYDRPLVTCSKVRCPQTGAITGFYAPADEVAGKSCLIVDDICDGGATFIGLGKVLLASGATSVDLLVTHGIFSRGKEVFAGIIRNIYSIYDFHRS